jgi:hypothetical protein
MHEHLKSLEGEEEDDLFDTQNELFRSNVRKVTKKKKKKVKRRKSSRTGSSRRSGSKLNQLTSAMEAMSRQLADTTERLMDVSETLSDSLLSVSMNSGTSNTSGHSPKHSPSKGGGSTSGGITIAEGDLASGAVNSNATGNASTRYDNKMTSPDDTEKEVRFADIIEQQQKDSPTKKKGGKGNAIKEGVKSKLQDLKQKN